MQIQDHTFLVSGGASGLGEGCVRAIVGAGGRAVIADVNADRGGALAGELGDAARFVATDVTDEASVKAAADAAGKLTGGDGLRGAISCAGIGNPELIVGKEGRPHSLSVFQKVIAVNLIGTFNVTRIAAAAMSGNSPLDDNERGVIIQTASVAAYEGQIGQTAYSASKGGVVSMTLPIARELARHGIRVVTIAPGLFETPMVHQLPEKILKALAAMIPFPSRLGQPAEFAALARHIVENTMLNGTTIRLDGSVRMAAK